MMRYTVTALICGAFLAAPLAAQTIWAPLQATPQEQQRPRGPALSSGTSATLRALDKMSGEVVELGLNVGATVGFGRLQIDLISCRYPTENPASDGFAFMEIRDAARDERLFRGWMVASSPALNALDHARYDIWVLRCQ
ncbi:DUF2155 domain-containing protein [Pararhodobacter oceanensis]|nr:DUF2155 domain-containing protein [Pararhodobacter oceanensis]